MDEKVLIGIIGVVLVPFLLAFIRLVWMTSILLEMHRNADQYGFGTVHLNKAVEAIATSTKRQADWAEDVSMVIRWLAAKIGGGELPPPRIIDPKG